jgi:hypothetical protein
VHRARRWRHDPHGLAAAAAANGDPTALLALDADALRTRKDRLAQERAALDRVATPAAQGAAATQVFDAVVEEVAELFGAAQVAMVSRVLAVGARSWRWSCPCGVAERVPDTRRSRS